MKQHAKRTSRIALLAALAALFVVPPTAGWSQPKGKGQPDARGKAKPDAEEEGEDGLHSCKKARGKFKVNLKPDTELKDLVTWAFSFTCRNFIYDSKISGRTPKVTLMTPEEMSAGEAWRVFLVALQSMGLTVVPKGRVLEIIEYQNAKTAPLPLYTRGRPGARDQMVRVVLRPDHLPVDELAKVLVELKSKSGDVKAIGKAGIVLVTDFGTNVQKMSRIMLAVDQPVVNERLYLIRVKHADATELATKLDEILGSKGETPSPAASSSSSRRRSSRREARQSAATPQLTSGGGSGVETALPSKIVPEERTNSLIVLGGEPAYLRVRALVHRLDVPMGGDGEGRINVYRLQHADAEELSTTLTAVISGIRPQTGNQQGNQRRPRAPAPAAGAGGSAAFEGEVRVTHDNPTNSLVIVASIADFRSLKSVIERLDVPRPQVYIEATIVEVNVDGDLSLGSTFHGGKDTSGGSVILGGVQHSDLSSLNVASLITATGLLGGALGPRLNNITQIVGNGVSIPSFGVFFTALATANNVNVLSTPHILTTDNQEAEISVGENIPYRAALTGLGGLGGQQQGGLGLIPTQSIQRQDVALTLKITPHISSENTVRLEIDLEIQDIASPNFQDLGPSWSQKSIKDTVIVDDQQSVVLGGLMADRVQEEESKVPLLGDIPLLGYLFKFKRKAKRKTNLLVLLTPYIVQDHFDLERIVEKRVREQQEFARAFSSFDKMKYRPEVDYRRKRGLIEEINKQVLRVEEDRAFIEAEAAKEVELLDGPIDYTDVGRLGEGDDSPDTGDPSEPSPAGDRPPSGAEPQPAPQEALSQ